MSRPRTRLALRLALALAALLALVGAAVAVAQAPGFSMSLDQMSYTAQQPVVVTWSGFPAGHTGEIWIDPASVPADVHKPASNSHFVSAAQGSVQFAGLPAGSYEVRAVDLSSSPAQVIGVDDFSVAGGGSSAGTSTTPPATAGTPTTSGAADSNAGSVRPTRSAFKTGQKVSFRWSGFTGVDQVQVWFASRGAALGRGPHGPYYTAAGPSGSHALPSPGGGSYEIQWKNLGRDSNHVTHHGGSFTVGGGGARSVASGGYGCYTSGLTRSSIGRLSILSSSRYSALGKTGAYRFSRATEILHMTSGPLKGRVAHYAVSPRRSIAFRRDENSVHGKPTIDASTTYCYYGRK